MYVVAQVEISITKLGKLPLAPFLQHRRRERLSSLFLLILWRFSLLYENEIAQLLENTEFSRRSKIKLNAFLQLITTLN